MRKILLSAALAAVCAMGVTAMASETAATVAGDYVAGDNNYNATAGTADAKPTIQWSLEITYPKMEPVD